MPLPFETDNGIGTRANLGLIALSTDETLEWELNRMADADGLALYTSRIPMVPSITSDTLRQMRADLPTAASLLPSSVPFDVIGYGCTSASTVIGPDGVRDAIREIFPDVQVTNPISSTIAACTALGIKRLGFVTPYVAEVSAAMRSLLEENGLTISAFGSFEEGDDRVVARITPASIRQAARTVASQAACDAIFISCTNLRVAGLAADLERDLGIPVLSSNLTLGWHMLQLAGIHEPKPQFGQLFGAS
ncbi:maleate cis-trans isomerase family protein [Coralliovum pocilloporae]|uniref:maleate cis-trans isomerase family protein n=1 Tax=Coralliovum pocilloporae TaxID=3066369 RepID=UPI003306FD2B